MSCAGAILDVKTEVVEPLIATVPPEASEMVKKEQIDPTLAALPSVFDPLPESPKDEKPIPPLQNLPHPNDG